MDLGLSDKTVLLTGGSKGIGRAIAEEFAREGASVMVIARGAEALEQTVASIRATGGKAAGFAADMFDPKQISAAVKATTETFGPADIMVSNLDVIDALRGSVFKTGFDDTKNEDFVLAHEQLVMSVIHLVREVLPPMRAKKWGRLLTVGSFAMKQPHAPPAQLILSNTERQAIVGLFKTLSFEMGIDNVTANIIGTGSFDTDLSTGYFERFGLSKAKLEEQWLAVGSGACRLGKPEELAALAVFLGSEAASFVSGEIITITGGEYKGTF